MNAAVAIFGVGVGVGMILGDSLRPVTVVQAVSSSSACADSASTTSPNNLSNQNEEDIQRPTQSTAASLLPAQ